MKIVIDIEEKRFRDIQRISTVQLKGRTPTLEQVIAKGTPIPKGHGELKDADVMINKLCTPEASELFGSVTCAEILDFINDEKTKDE